MLTEDQIKTIKGANEICFYHYENKQDYKGILKLIKENENAITEIPVNSRVIDHNVIRDIIEHQTEKIYYCFHHQFKDELWKTVEQILAPGCEIELIWNKDNNSELIEENNLHKDELRIKVKTHTQIYEFLLFSNVFRDDIARMIKTYNLDD